MLIQELKSLVAFDVLRKKSFKEIPPRVEYSLTEKGLEVLPIIDMMKEFWARTAKKLPLTTDIAHS